MSPQSLMILRAAESSCSWHLTVDVPKWNGRHFVVKIIYQFIPKFNNMRIEL